MPAAKLFLLTRVHLLGHKHAQHLDDLVAAGRPCRTGYSLKKRGVHQRRQRGQGRIGQRCGGRACKSAAELHQPDEAVPGFRFQQTPRALENTAQTALATGRSFVDKADVPCQLAGYLLDAQIAHQRRCQHDTQG